MATEGFSHVVSFEVRGRMPSNCYIVVINEKLDIETICDCNAGSLCSVSFHLRTIRTQCNHHFARFATTNAVYPWPYVTQSPRTELDTWSAAQFWMAWQATVALPVSQQFASWHVPTQNSKQILSSHSVTSLIE